MEHEQCVFAREGDRPLHLINCMLGRQSLQSTASVYDFASALLVTTSWDIFLHMSM